jgi:hypothetical protein
MLARRQQHQRSLLLLPLVLLTAVPRAAQAAAAVTHEFLKSWKFLSGQPKRQPVQN